MNKGRRAWRGRVWMLVIALVITGMATVMVGGCGGDDSTGAETETTAASGGSSETAAAEGEGEGVALGEEILTTFDELVAEAAALAAPKPEPSVLKPQLEELYATYETTMTELNTRYLALRDADEFAFRECNGYISDNRPQHVYAKDNTLSDAVVYYNLELGDQEIVSLLSETPVELLDIAVNQN